MQHGKIIKRKKLNDKLFKDGKQSMFKKGLSLLIAAIFYLVGFTKTSAVRSEQIGNTSVFEYCDADDIGRTVDALWKVYYLLPESTDLFSPIEAARRIGSILFENGVDHKVTRNNTTECSIIASAILQRCDALAGIQFDCKTITEIRWFKPASSKSIRIGVYRFIEEFKYASYVQGDNDYVALIFEGDLVTGTTDPIENNLLGKVSIDGRRDWFNHHCDHITKPSSATL